VLPVAAQTFAVNHVSIGAGGTADLTDNDLVVRGGDIGSWNGSAYTGLSGMIQNGRGDGSWNGTGLVTSRWDDYSNDTTTLAIAPASQVLGIGPSDTALYNGETVTGDDVIIKYTFQGDIDLNGEINGDDYFYLDSSILLSGSIFGYHVGDVDMNGVLDGDDYFWLDSQISSQGPPL
jgi:hypothetical protein